MIDYILILENNYPGTHWIIDGHSTNYDNIIWHDTTPKPTKDELDNQWETTLAKVNGNAYKLKRAVEYPDFRDYLDGIVKGDQAQMQAYIDACNAVKLKYPKGV
jgi:hypothetical protein